MLDLSTILNIVKYTEDGEGGFFTDYSLKLADPSSPAVPISVGTQDYLYVGFDRPIKNFFVSLSTPNDVFAPLMAEIFNGTDWEECPIWDETYAFNASGTIQLLKEPTKFTVLTEEKYVIRLKFSIATSPMQIQFIGQVLSTDQDLLIENPYILDQNLMMGQPNHLKFHVAARNEIIQTFLNKGYKLNNGDRLTYWHLLDVHELKQASVFLTLSKIYLALSDNVDDTWMQKSREYRKLYNHQVEVYRLTLDLNSDGKLSDSEKGREVITRYISR